MRQVSWPIHLFLKNYGNHKEDLKTKYLPASKTWVAEEEAGPAGFISLMDNYIGGLFVKPSSQGNGIGSKLIQHVQGNKDNLTVGVYKENPRARKFYEKHGFVSVGEEIQEETGQVIITMAWKR